MKSLIFAVLTLPALVRAEMTSMTFAGKVKSFDATTATLEVNQKDVKVKREAIKTKNFKVGDAVIVMVDMDDAERRQK